MADVVIVGPGSGKAIAQGIAAAGKGATVVQFTATPPEDEMTLKPHDLYFNETRLVPSYSAGPTTRARRWRWSSAQSCRAADLVTHRFPLERVTEAYAMAQKPESLKVIVTFGSNQTRARWRASLRADESSSRRPLADDLRSSKQYQ